MPIVIFGSLLKKKRNYRLYRVDFLYILVGIIWVRLILPVEFFYTITIPLPLFMNKLSSFLDFHIINNISIGMFLIMVWITGAIFKIITYIRRIYYSKAVNAMIIDNYTSFNLSDILSLKENDKDHSVYIVDFIKSPMILGFSNMILLPDMDLSDDDIKNILLHEYQHIKNKDVLMKQIVHVLSILYWWFFPIYYFKKQFDLFLEMRVDYMVTKNMSESESIAYAQSLIDVQKQVINCKNTLHAYRNISTFLINDDASILSYRVNYMLEADYTGKTSKMIKIMFILLPVVTSLIIFEPYHEPKETTTFSIDVAEDIYIIKHKDGSYSLVIDGEKGSINNVDEEALKGLPIVVE